MSGRTLMGLSDSPRYVVSVSSGLGSAYAWKLWCDRYGPENVVGVFTDVNGEHPDNYRFLADEIGGRMSQTILLEQGEVGDERRG